MASTRTVRRNVGRPRQAAGGDARELLLDAAITLFAERGVAGTTIAEIAAKAGVTAAMVHYYFTSRDQLLDAITEERLRPIATGVWAPVAESKQIVPTLRGVVQRILEATEVNPWLPSLWLREVISEGGELRVRLLKRPPFTYMANLVGSVAAAQRRGEINPELEPRLVVLSVIGLTLVPLANLRILQQIPIMQGIRREDIARHAEALLVSAFSKPTCRRTKAGRGRS